jgi:hypothetical protein
VSGVANTAPLTSASATKVNNTPTAVNDVVASNIAASVATATNLSVAPSVTSLAISTQIQSELPNSDNSSISKPQLRAARSQITLLLQVTRLILLLPNLAYQSRQSNGRTI